MGSGDDEPGGDVETFNQLFPLGHAYFGYIDLIGRQNALDLHFDLKVAPRLSPAGRARASPCALMHAGLSRVMAHAKSPPPDLV